MTAVTRARPDEIPTLETERLILRAPALEDLDALALFGAGGRTEGVGGPFDRAEAWRRLCGMIGHWSLRGFGRWAIDEKGGPSGVGFVGPYYPEGWPEPEIAWTVFSGAEGRGIAFEAATAARSYAYTTLGWHTAISLVVEGNTRSQTLARRLGCAPERLFTHETYGEMTVWRHPGPT
ncbi:MAG: GNAT family N-acetyltransferase [Pseudomonadota bacterium]